MKYIISAIITAISSVVILLPNQAKAWTGNLTVCNGSISSDAWSRIDNSSDKIDFSSSTDSYVLIALTNGTPATNPRFLYHPTSQLKIEFQGGSDWLVRTISGGVRVSDTDLNFNFPSVDDPYGGGNVNGTCIVEAHNVIYENDYPITYPDSRGPSTPPLCEYNPAIPATDPLCVAPPDPEPEPEPNPSPQHNGLNAGNKIGLVITFTAGLYIIWLLRYRSSS